MIQNLALLVNQGHQQGKICIGPVNTTYRMKTLEKCHKPGKNWTMRLMSNCSVMCFHNPEHTSDFFLIYFMFYIWMRMKRWEKAWRVCVYNLLYWHSSSVMSTSVTQEACGFNYEPLEREDCTVCACVRCVCAGLSFYCSTSSIRLWVCKWGGLFFKTFTYE